ncbi:MAG: CoB--CoM heterodisulfide reductase iron-sulfur subunit A family protein [Calditrichaeota bacterium]|nr:CoB--CoM heterodisulfide reductase iron-sulfur subunit A family protein [Calditrichota bacterium]
MMDAGRHPNITLFTNSEVVGLRGSAGDFTATVRRYPRYVDESRCTACGKCSEVCPVVVPNEFDVGLGARKAIYSPFAQAVPSAYIIDWENCLNGQIIVCGQCSRACERKAIDYDMRAQDVELPVGAVIVATGFDVFDPFAMKTYGYSVSPEVMTGIEFERMLNASGPTRGHVIRPSDRKVPRRLAFVQCVGVRGEHDCQYCSRFCCMNSVKNALLAKEHEPGIEEVTIFYSDIRAFGKGYEGFFNRSKKYDYIRYFRGKPSKIVRDQQSGELRIFVENTATGRPEVVVADMVVLASAGVPAEGTARLAQTLGIELDETGFFKVADQAGEPLATTREGIFLCGCARGPEDIPDSVAQGSGAAAAAQRFVAESRVEEVKREIVPLPTDGPPRIGVFLCHCGANIAGVVDVPGVAEWVRQLPGVVHVEDNLFLCSDTGQKLIQQRVLEERLNRVVVAACTPRTHEPIFQESLRLVGFNPYLFEMVNVRDQCSWVHSQEPERATLRARDQIRMGVARAHRLEPLQKREIPIERSVLVIGGGIAGIEAALRLEAQGFSVHLVEKEEQLGGRLRELHRLAPADLPAQGLLQRKLGQLAASKVNVLTGTEVKEVSGFVGNFDVVTTGGPLRVGALILAIGAQPYQPTEEFAYGRSAAVLTNFQLEQLLRQAEGVPRIGGKPVTRVAFIQCVGSRDPEKNPNCSRICCVTTVRQARLLRKLGAEVVVFYRDMRTASHGGEEAYRQARGEGVIFVRVPDDRPPEVKPQTAGCHVCAYDALLRDTVEVDVDAVVLAAGLVPREPDTSQFREMLKVPCGPDGFVMERHPKLGPVETTSEGIFVAGCVQGPKGVGDALAQAAAAAAKAAILLSRDKVSLEATTCTVIEERCRACGTCVKICQFHAPELHEVAPGVRVARINEALCKGCGTCASWCPSEAIKARHFTDEQIEAMLEAMLLEEVA